MAPQRPKGTRPWLRPSALAAAREVETHRRNTSKNAQEQAVKHVLAGAGFGEVAVRDIPMLPLLRTGEFAVKPGWPGPARTSSSGCAISRVMAIECKVSNSAVNSYKRLVHDTGGKAATWYRELGPPR